MRGWERREHWSARRHPKLGNRPPATPTRAVCHPLRTPHTRTHTHTRTVLPPLAPPHLLVPPAGVEGQVSGHHGEQHHAQRPHVHRRPLVGLAGHDLRSCGGRAATTTTRRVQTEGKEGGVKTETRIHAAARRPGRVQPRQQVARGRAVRCCAPPQPTTTPRHLCRRAPRRLCRLVHACVANRNVCCKTIRVRVCVCVC